MTDNSSLPLAVNNLERDLLCDEQVVKLLIDELRNLHEAVAELRQAISNMARPMRGPANIH